MTAGPARRLLIPGLMTLVMLATLLALGTWQVSRLLWKRDLLAAIAASEQRPALPLGPSPPAFARVRAEGSGVDPKGCQRRAVTKRVEIGLKVNGGWHATQVFVGDGHGACIEQQGDNKCGTGQYRACLGELHQPRVSGAG